MQQYSLTVDIAHRISPHVVVVVAVVVIVAAAIVVVDGFALAYLRPNSICASIFN